jgi:hypothetical protein
VELVVLNSGQATLAVNDGNPAPFRVGKSDLAGLRTDVEEIDWGALKPVYRPEVVIADGYQYLLAHGGVEVAISDPARPEPLMALMASLDRIAAAHTPPQIDSGGD